VPHDDRPTKPPPWPDSERPTLVPCQACGGNNVTEMRESDAHAGRFSAVVCRWCTNGGMSPEQVRRWFEHQAKPKG
jgi:hypothetical protein